MPASAQLTSVRDRQLLIQLGQRLRRARLEQGLTTTALAEHAGISRMTLGSVEAGEPSPTMGTYLRVMSALGFAGDLALVASGELRGAVPAESPSTKLTLGAKGAPHEIQDLQSLMLHEEAVKLLRKRPELMGRALETLDKWRATGNSHSRVLWDEWSVILNRKDWRRVLARTRRSNELRQASPLPVLLPEKVREQVLKQVQELKRGVELGHVISATVRKARSKGGS